MNTYYSFLVGGLSVIVVVLIAWLTATLVRVEQTIVKLNEETDELEVKQHNCATYPYLNTYLGYGMGYPYWLVPRRSAPVVVTV